MMMENYYKGHNESRFEHSFEQKDNSDSNTLALDLSRKKRVASTLSEVRIIRSNGSSQTLPSAKKQKYQEIRIPFLDENTQTPIADGIIQPIGSSQILPSATKQKYQEIQIPFLNENTQTPITGSSAMLSPYSASNSPKETKTDSVDYHENSNQLKHTVPLTSTHVTPGVTMATPQQPSLLAFPNEAMNIPVVPKMYLPYIETPQSFITNNEIRRIVSMPAECSTSDTKPSTSSDATKKTPRPFKAYPNNFLTVVNTVDHNSNENYAKFRQMILENIKKVNKNTSNPKMRRVSKSISNPGLPTSTVDEKDAIYWERRKKNNEAAKRSRDARRAKEDELAIRTSFLEYENAQLRMEVQRLKMEAQRHIYIQ